MLAVRRHLDHSHQLPRDLARGPQHGRQRQGPTGIGPTLCVEQPGKLVSDRVGVGALEPFKYAIPRGSLGDTQAFAGGTEQAERRQAPDQFQVRKRPVGELIRAERDEPVRVGRVGAAQDCFVQRATRGRPDVMGRPGDRPQWHVIDQSKAIGLGVGRQRVVFVGRME